jgi:hypothetical protein
MYVQQKLPEILLTKESDMKIQQKNNTEILSPTGTLKVFPKYREKY